MAWEIPVQEGSSARFTPSWDAWRRGRGSGWRRAGGRPSPISLCRPNLGLSLRSAVVGSREGCLLACTAAHDCQAAEWKGAGATCRLFNDRPGSADLVPDPAAFAFLHD